MFSYQKATTTGLIAVIMWGSAVGVIRSICEDLGPIAGPASVYSVSALMLMCTQGLPKFKNYSKTYLLLGGFLFTIYEMSFSLSLSFAHTSQQAIEVSMLNYLWPTMTVVFAILFLNKKATWLIVPGVLTAFIGVACVMCSKGGFDFAKTLENLTSNPICYMFGFAAPFLWATYNTVIVKVSNGQTGVTFFMIFISIVLWSKYFMGVQPPMHFTLHTAICLFLVSCSMGLGYAAWNIGIVYGNITLLAVASYFIPVVSAGIAGLMLSASLNLTFWMGATLVTLGSIISYIATRRRKGSK